MTQEEKELLLKDLCARLPYGVEVEYDNCACEVLSIDKDNGELTISKSPGYSPNVRLEEIKLYLFPMSSMTGVEVLEYISLKESIIASDDITYHFETHESIDWLNKNKFDYRGLIPKGLANDATGLGIY